MGDRKMSPATSKKQLEMDISLVAVVVRAGKVES
jgi:hypothetical protein